MNISRNAKSITSQTTTMTSQRTAHSSFNLTDNKTSFYVFLIINVIFSFFDSGIIGFLDSAVVICCGKSNGKVKFHIQRLFGLFGNILGVYVTGLIADSFQVTSITKYSRYF